MADWELTFRTPTHASIKVDACQQLLASIYGSEATTTHGEVEGNPYDSYWGGITVETASAAGVTQAALGLPETFFASSPLAHIVIDERVLLLYRADGVMVRVPRP